MTELIYIVFFLAFGFGMGWLFAKAHAMNDYNNMYSHITSHVTSRMVQAMHSLLFEQEDIDRVIERMGCKVIPGAIPPPPTPPEKPAKKRDFNKEPYTLEEVIYRLSPKLADGSLGEWYCVVSQPHKAWRINYVEKDGRIKYREYLDMKTHELHIEPPIGGVASAVGDTVENLAKIFIDYNFRFLDDFDRNEWKLYEM